MSDFGITFDLEEVRQGQSQMGDYPKRPRGLASAMLLTAAFFSTFGSARAESKVARITAAAQIQSPHPGIADSDPADLTFVNFYRGVKGLLDAYVEYDRSTCELIDSGVWTLTTNPKYGKVTFGTLQSTLANGECPGVTFTFAASFYQWTNQDPKISEDKFGATWDSQSFSLSR